MLNFQYSIKTLLNSVRITVAPQVVILSLSKGAMGPVPNRRSKEALKCETSYNLPFDRLRMTVCGCRMTV